jgi:hypothetical protein
MTLNNTAATVAGFQPAIYVSFCAGDGQGSACPCGNASALGDEAGCLNSLGLAGKLAARGTASITNDTVVLLGTGMPDASALYFQGTTQLSGGAGVVFGDGLRCAGGVVRRLATRTNSGNASQVPSGGPSLSALGLLSGPGAIHYQVWYRNAAAFCSASTFNLTNGLTVAWAP